jgi:hypothetical protein
LEYAVSSFRRRGNPEILKDRNQVEDLGTDEIDTKTGLT